MTLRLVQIGMNTADMAGSLRLLSDVFGFANAGAQGLWGPAIAGQALPLDSRAVIWWLLGREAGVQIELFQHTRPVPRPLRPDWRPCDLGWVRFGVAVADFDAALAALAVNAVAALAPPVVRDGLRRVSFREPFVGCIVEVLEDGVGAPWSVPGDERLPAVVYATSSVSDLAGARHYYETLIGLAVEPIERLHAPGDEAGWGLAGAARDGFLVRAGGAMRLEVVAYRDPVGRPRPADYRTADQGVVNAALEADTAAEAEALFARLAEAGHASPFIGRAEGQVTGYITDAEREIEIVCLPPAVRRILGFEPAAPFIAAMV